MKKNIKALLSSVAAVSMLLNAMPWSISASATEISAVPMCEIDFDSLNIGSNNIPGGVLPNGNPSTMYNVVADKDNVSPSGKVLVGSGDGPEIYFNIDEPIVVYGATQEADYFVTAKMRPHKTDNSAMQYKVAFLEQDNHSSRVGFLGIQGNKLLFTDKAIEGDKWYNYLIRLHVGNSVSDAYIGEKIYPVGENEPEKWDDFADSNRISNYYNVYRNVDCIGIKGWLQNGCGIAGFSVYKYDKESADEYDKLRDDIDNIGTVCAEMNTEQIKEYVDEMNLKAEDFPGNAGSLLRDAMKPVYSETEKLNTAEEKFTELKQSEISPTSIFDLYSKADEIKKSISDTVFTGARDALNGQINDWIREKLEPEYSVFTSSDNMEYKSSTEMNDGKGWNGEWKSEGEILFNNGFTLNGSVERNFSYPVDTGFECEFAFELKDVALSGNGFTAECGGIKFGAKLDDGIYYPIINDSLGTTPLNKDEKYNFVVRAKNAGDNTCELRVYNENSNISDTPDITIKHSISNSDSLRIEADGTGFGKISKEMYPVDYAEKIEKDLFNAKKMSGDTEEAVEAKKKVIGNLENDLSLIRDGAIKDYLNTIFGEVSDSLKVNELEGIIKNLEKKVTKKDIQEARNLVDSISNATLKNKYDGIIKTYEEYVNNTVPVIESAGIEGEVKENSTVIARISTTDPIGNGAGYKAEWLLNGSVAGTGDSFLIPNNSASSSLSLRVTAINENGKEGKPVTTDSVKIRGNSIGYVSGSGGGGGSSGIRVPAVISTPKPENPSSNQEENDEKDNNSTTSNLNDIVGHWAEKSIRALAERGVVNGVDNERFMPDNKITRAEFVKMLTTALCIDPIDYDGAFKDVSNNDWFAKYVAAANAEKIVSGDDEMNFMPSSAVTREQVAIMLVRAYKRYYINVNIGDINSFADVSKVSDWAYSDMNAAVGLGLIGGKSENELAPQDVTTRAEAAVMLERLINSVLSNG